MSWVPCPSCNGQQPSKDTCAECHQNGGAFAIAPTPAPDACWACGKPLSEHKDTLGAMTPRMPCLGLKKHYRRG